MPRPTKPGAELCCCHQAQSPRLLRADLEPPPHELVDVHVHLGGSDSGELFYPRLPGQEWLELAEPARVTTAFAFPPLLAHYRKANEELAAWAATTNGAVRPFARLGGTDIPWTTHQLWQLRRKLRNRWTQREDDIGDDISIYSGIKLLPHLDGLPSNEVFDRINAANIPIVIHGGIHVPPAWIEKAILPRTTGIVIVAHLGAFPAGDRELEDALDLARRHERVYLDTSGVWLAAFLSHAADRVGDKLVFGSDAPLTHPLVAWHHLRCAVPDDDLLERIGWRTATELFDL